MCYIITRQHVPWLCWALANTDPHTPPVRFMQNYFHVVTSHLDPCEYGGVEDVHASIDLVWDKDFGLLDKTLDLSCPLIVNYHSIFWWLFDLGYLCEWVLVGSRKEYGRWKEEGEGEGGDEAEGKRKGRGRIGKRETSFWPLSWTTIAWTVCQSLLETTALQCKSVCMRSGHTHYWEAWTAHTHLYNYCYENTSTQSCEFKI